MVVLEYEPGNTTLTSVEDDDFLNYGNKSKVKCHSKTVRDTSTSPRDALTEMRQTHSSILNVTSDAEDSEDDDASQQSSVLFAELSEPPRLEEKPCSPSGHETPKPLVACCNTSDHPITTWFDRSTNNIRTATESFAENLCPANLSDEPCKSFNKYVTSGRTALQHQMEMDILAILGCTEQPSDEELETWTSPLLCPVEYGNSIDGHVSKKESIPSRAQRIHRFRTENKIQIPAMLKRTNTIDNSMLKEMTVSSEQTFHDTLGSLFGLEESLPPIANDIKPSTVQEDDGYDSDPEIRYRTQYENSCEKPLQDPLNISSISEEVSNGTNDTEIINTVQESLNYSWALTWHATKEAMTAVGCEEKERKCFDPICIQLWFERGHILHFGQTIVEPQFMWRSVLGQHLKPPYQVRLLNVCRVLPLDDIDRSKYPLARASHSFVIRLVHGEEFVFEAASEKDRDAIVSRWKLVIARLAMLAVFEDIDAMSSEFFTPMVDPQTLTYE